MNWFKKLRQAFIRDIATETTRQMTSGGWGKFLPPVAHRDAVYILRDDGALYRMHQDHATGMELITKIAAL